MTDLEAPATALTRERFPAHAPVLAGHPLVPGVRLADTSRFGDDTWQLKHAQTQRHQNAIVINFALVPEPFRPTAKELAFLLLRGDLPPGLKPVRSIASVRKYLTGLNAVFTWLQGRGVTTAAAVTPGDIEAFTAHVAGLRVAHDTREARHRALRLLWLFRSTIGDPLTFDPASVGRVPGAPSRTGGRGGRENATSRIPEQVHAPMLVWALRWVDDFSEDVLAAYEEWQQLDRWTKKSRKRRGQEPLARAQVIPSVIGVLDRYRAEGRPLPGWKGGANLSHLAREARVQRGTLGAGRPSGKLIRQAAAELGVADDTYLRTPMAGLLEGVPWRGPVPYEGIGVLTRLLQTACYITISFLSGLRDSEVKHLKRGCVQVWRDETGRIVRRRLHGRAFKGEADHNGAEATWVISAPAHRAVDVLERLQPARQKYLFALLPSSPGYVLQRGRNEARTTSTTNHDLSEFRDWINTYCRGTGRDDGIPPVNGREWRVTTSQFRRTLAWFIARRPGGVIAGALQYRHLRVQMFEGYAGTSDSGFRDEVESEEAIARGEKLGDLITSDEFHRLTGPAAAEAESRLAEFERHVQFQGKVINDAKRLQRHMTRHDPHIYPGRYVTCVHNPDRALCRRDDGQAGPSLPDCQPLRCRNVALSAENTAHLRAALEAHDRELARADQLAPFVRHRLQTRRQELADFLTETAVTGPDTKTETP
ncbi:integrase [Kitasatospora sp. MAA19]|uniref:hypothetical protein n=1 Tax=Kitasatospora sp. MAA19 TaxID=3035090 RepID=UPI00247391AD|nr:hypothetical protein [Kitasatospora sp. MAA19]MDH6709893.1 integrase [Kitasatospora sp. MAA19]